MLKNNKGSTVLIVSIVVGVLLLSVGGYFGYNWYQDKLLKERIAKVEKVQSAILDLNKLYNSAFFGNFDISQIEKLKSQLKEIENLNKNLEDLEIDKEVESEVKKCTEDIKGLVKDFNRIFEFNEIINKKGSLTPAETREGQNILNNLQKFDDSKSCEKAETEINDLIKDLKKK